MKTLPPREINEAVHFGYKRGWGKAKGFVKGSGVKAGVVMCKDK